MWPLDLYSDFIENRNMALNVVSFILDLVLVTLGIYVGVRTYPLKGSGQATSGLKILSVSLIWLGLVHLLQTIMTLYSMNSNLIAWSHRTFVAIGFLGVIYGFEKIRNVMFKF